MKTQGEAAIPFVFVSYSETKARVQTGTDWMQQHVGSKGERTTVPMKNLSLTPNMTGNKCHTLKQFETMPYFVDTKVLQKNLVSLVNTKCDASND